MNFRASRLISSILVEQFKGARVAFAECLFKVATEAQVAAEKHVGIYIAPYFVQVGHRARFALQVGDSGNRNIRAYLSRALFAGRLKRTRCRFFDDGPLAKGVLLEHCFAPAGVAQLVHEAQAGHRILRIADGCVVLGCDF